MDTLGGTKGREDELLAEATALRHLGLAEDEAHLVASLRLAKREGTAAADAEQPRRHGLVGALALGVMAGLAIKSLELLGISEDAQVERMALNLSLFSLPFVAAWFLWRRRPGRVVVGVIAAVFVAVALVVNLYPFDGQDSTFLLSVVAVPVLLWLVMGVAHAGGAWRSSEKRMEFIRFTGEWIIYYGLIAVGGAILVGLTGAAFSTIDIDVFGFLARWVIPCGAMGATVVAAYLVETRKGVIENVAPVLTRVFTPLATIMTLTLLVSMVVAGWGVQIDRDLLIICDALLVLVLGLLVYSWSAREPRAAPGWFDRMQLLLVTAAIIVDLVALVAITTRIQEWGFTANRTAALALNLVLLVNLVRSAWLVAGLLRGTREFSDLERWQTGYLPVYAAWALVVAVALPPAFSFA